MRRRYSDVEKAEALAALQANGGNLRHTAATLGLPVTTLKAWRDGLGMPPEPERTELCTQKKQDLADCLEEVAHRLVEALPGKVLDAGLKDTAMSLGIAIDKMRLLREKPTTITKTDELSLDERACRIAELLERAEGRRRAALSGRGGSGTPDGTPARH